MMSKEQPSDDQLVEFLVEAYEDAVKASDILDSLEDAVAEADEGGECSSDMFVSDIITSFFSENENVGVLGNYVLVAEIVGEDGGSDLIVLTSENLPVWSSRGMLLVADEFLMDSGGVCE